MTRRSFFALALMPLLPRPRLRSSHGTAQLLAQKRGGTWTVTRYGHSRRLDDGSVVQHYCIKRDDETMPEFKERCRIEFGWPESKLP